MKLNSSTATTIKNEVVTDIIALYNGPALIDCNDDVEAVTRLESHSAFRIAHLAWPTHQTLAQLWNKADLSFNNDNDEDKNTLMIQMRNDFTHGKEYHGYTFSKNFLEALRLLD